MVEESTERWLEKAKDSYSLRLHHVTRGTAMAGHMIEMSVTQVSCQRMVINKHIYNSSEPP
jgi:hypothetical protein